MRRSLAALAARAAWDERCGTWNCALCGVVGRCKALKGAARRRRWLGGGRAYEPG
ncbi:MAG: hypothetical protein KDD73_14060 [Anaerolineales bacterium]|nr:hypothetical protein [Anaerolineales bacterium]MCB9172259.1 hypothetical protein [Ardenticatenales bacterium]